MSRPSTQWGMIGKFGRLDCRIWFWSGLLLEGKGLRIAEHIEKERFKVRVNLRDEKFKVRGKSQWFKSGLKLKLFGRS